MGCNISYAMSVRVSADCKWKIAQRLMFIWERLSNSINLCGNTSGKVTSLALEKSCSFYFPTITIVCYHELVHAKKKSEVLYISAFTRHYLWQYALRWFSVVSLLDKLFVCPVFSYRPFSSVVRKCVLILPMPLAVIYSTYRSSKV